MLILRTTNFILSFPYDGRMKTSAGFLESQVSLPPAPQLQGTTGCLHAEHRLGRPRTRQVRCSQEGFEFPRNQLLLEDNLS